MSKIELDENPKPSIWKMLGTIIGILSLIVGIFAWLVLYSNQILSLSLASLSIILSIFGLKGRYRNFAIGVLVVSGTLLIVIGIMYAVFFYIFNSL